MITRLNETMSAALVSNNSRQFHRNFHFTWKKKGLVADRNLQSIETLLALDLSQYHKSGSMFSSSKPGGGGWRCQQRLPQTGKCPVFVLARPTCASSFGELPQELGR